MKFILAVAALVISLSPCSAYDLKNLTTQDLLILGKGLDALPRGDSGALYDRLQQQIIQQDQATAKAQEDAIRKKVEDEKPKPAPPKDEPK